MALLPSFPVLKVFEHDVFGLLSIFGMVLVSMGRSDYFAATMLN